MRSEAGSPPLPQTRTPPARRSLRRPARFRGPTPLPPSGAPLHLRAVPQPTARRRHLAAPGATPPAAFSRGCGGPGRAAGATTNMAAAAAATGGGRGAGWRR